LKKGVHSNLQCSRAFVAAHCDFERKKINMQRQRQAVIFLNLFYYIDKLEQPARPAISLDA